MKNVISIEMYGFESPNLDVMDLGSAKNIQKKSDAVVWELIEIQHIFDQISDVPFISEVAVVPVESLAVAQFIQKAPPFLRICGTDEEKVNILTSKLIPLGYAIQTKKLERCVSKLTPAEICQEKFRNKCVKIGGVLGAVILPIIMWFVLFSEPGHYTIARHLQEHFAYGVFVLVYSILTFIGFGAIGAFTRVLLGWIFDEMFSPAYFAIRKVCGAKVS